MGSAYRVCDRARDALYADRLPQGKTIAKRSESRRPASTKYSQRSRCRGLRFIGSARVLQERANDRGRFRDSRSRRSGLCLAGGNRRRGLSLRGEGRVNERAFAALPESSIDDCSGVYRNESAVDVSENARAGVEHDTFRSNNITVHEAIYASGGRYENFAIYHTFRIDAFGD